MLLPPGDTMTSEADAVQGEHHRQRAHATATAIQWSCSFCAKPSPDVEKMIAGPGVYICNECVGQCNEILRTEPQESLESDTRLPVWEDGMTEEQILDQLPRVAAVGAQTEVSLQ